MRTISVRSIAYASARRKWRFGYFCALMIGQYVPFHGAITKSLNGLAWRFSPVMTGMYVAGTGLVVVASHPPV